MKTKLQANGLGLLFLLSFLFVGCGSSQDDFVAVNNPGPTPNNLTVNLTVAPNTSPQTAGIRAQISPSASRFNITVFDQNLTQIAREELTTQRSVEFVNVGNQIVLVRIEAFRANGARIGFFDRVVDVTTTTSVTIDTLRYDLNAPPTPVIPNASATGFLAYNGLPSGITANNPFSVAVSAYNADGTLDTDFANNATLVANTGSLVNAPAPAVFANGVATFSAVTFANNSSLSAVSLTADAQGLAAATTPSIAFTPVNVGPAASRLNLVSITDDNNDSTFRTNENFDTVVEVLDSNGQRVTQSRQVTLVVDSGPSSATLGGTTTVNVINGLATFSDNSLNVAGTYSLQAQSTGLTAAVIPLNVSAPVVNPISTIVPRKTFRQAPVSTPTST